MEPKNGNTEQYPVVRTLSEIQPIPISDQVDVNNQYIGYASLGTGLGEAGWKIIKIVKSGTVTTAYYADGDEKYDNVWNDRATLSYKR